MKDRYFSWLCEQVKLDKHSKKNKTYIFLMKGLHNKEYYWTVPYDENRSEEGKELRIIFSEKDADKLIKPCSLLEMLISLAKRWRVDLSSVDGSEEGFERYFWLMLTNLGLVKFTDNKFDQEKVNDILEKLLDRTYDSDGKGGLFPLKNPESDQRKVEIWYQLHAYLNENENL